MLLDSAAAKALFVVIMMSTQRADEIKPQLPLQVDDRGDLWLVKGTPFTRKTPEGAYCMTYMFFRKATAEVTGIMSVARFIPTETQTAEWRKTMTSEDYARVFGPQTRFEPQGIHDLYSVLYGGLLNTPDDATDYAFILMQTKPALAAIPKATLRATEHDGIWSVTTATSDRTKPLELLRLSRQNGKVVWGDL